MKASSSSASRDAQQQEEAKQICPLVPPPDDPYTTFEAAMGWFWGPQRDFDHVEGVIETVVGYSGSISHSTLNPTYRNILDYAESIRVVYNTEKLPYEQVLDYFFEFHYPSDPKYAGTQYRSAIFVHTPEQQLLAEAACKQRGQIGTFIKIEKASDFYRAEEYHQKYVEKSTTARY